jgi:hypothetical protein
MPFLSSIRRVQIGVGLLDQSPPGPGHPVEAGTVWKLKSSIVMGSEVRDLIWEGSPQKKNEFSVEPPRGIDTPPPRGR